MPIPEDTEEEELAISIMDGPLCIDLDFRCSY